MELARPAAACFNGSLKCEWARSGEHMLRRGRGRGRGLRGGSTDHWCFVLTGAGWWAGLCAGGRAFCGITGLISQLTRTRPPHTEHAGFPDQTGARSGEDPNKKHPSVGAGA
ncbi:hypothetical protein MHYP_G00033220 [Metynnis hypsauchen]